jgi:hypothetical protein
MPWWPEFSWGPLIPLVGVYVLLILWDRVRLR